MHSIIGRGKFPPGDQNIMNTYTVDCYANKDDEEPEKTIQVSANSPEKAAVQAANKGPWTRVAVRP